MRPALLLLVLFVSSAAAAEPGRSPDLRLHREVLGRVADPPVRNGMNLSICMPRSPEELAKLHAAVARVSLDVLNAGAGVLVGPAAIALELVRAAEDAGTTVLATSGR